MASATLLDPNSILTSIYGNSNYSNMQGADLTSLLQGTPYIDASAYYNSLSPDDRAAIDQNGTNMGISGLDWLNGHFLDTMQKGDPVAQQMFSQYGGYQGGLLNLISSATQQATGDQTTANTALRSSNINDLATLGPAAQAAWAAANPQYAQFTSGLLGTLNGLNAGAPGPVGTATAATPMARTTAARYSPAARGALAPQLESDASRLLATNGALSAGEQRGITETVMGAYGDRGLANSAGAISNLALQSDAARQARATQNQSYATSVAGLSQGYNLADASARNATNTFNAGQANQGSQYNAGLAGTTSQFNASAANSMGQFNANLSASNANDAWNRNLSYAGLLGSQSDAINGLVSGTSPSAAVAATDVGTAQQSQQSITDLLSGIYNYNANATNAASIANSNNSAATTGAEISGGTALAGSAVVALAIF